MNIQIFGKTKCFDTKKAERYFKERGIKYQYIDLKEKGMSKGELNAVCQAVEAWMLCWMRTAGIRTLWRLCAISQKRTG